MIDLSKLKALQYPTKDIAVNIAGEEQTFTIQALDDETSVQIALLGEKTDNAENIFKLHRLVLKNGICGATDDDIDVLCKKAMSSALRIIEAVRDLTMQFTEIRKTTTDNAKKN